MLCKGSESVFFFGGLGLGNIGLQRFEWFLFFWGTFRGELSKIYWFTPEGMSMILLIEELLHQWNGLTLSRLVSHISEAEASTVQSNIFSHTVLLTMSQLGEIAESGGWRWRLWLWTCRSRSQQHYGCWWGEGCGYVSCFVFCFFFCVSDMWLF